MIRITVFGSIFVFGYFGRPPFVQAGTLSQQPLPMAPLSADRPWRTFDGM